MSRFHIVGYARAVRGTRYAVHAMSLLEAYQAEVRARRDGIVIMEWSYGTEAGRKMLGLPPGSFYLPAPLDRPPGLARCPPCDGKGCPVCRWSGEVTARALGRLSG